jgi:ribulose-phosphate 3-epimerase
MNVIPVINCPDVECVIKKLETAKSFLYEGDMVHLDITDGSFSQQKTWNEPLAWVNLKSPFTLEVHLMVDHPEEHADNWFAAGARRLIVHAESITPESLHVITQAAERYKVEVMLSSRPETMIEDITPFLKYCNAFQVLAVNPGAAGQVFMPFVKEKIAFLREEMPNATIEVDGGMNPETALAVKAVGADTIVSASYIFDSADPKTAYETLRNI